MTTEADQESVPRLLAQLLEIRTNLLRDLGTAPAHRQHTRWWADRLVKMARVHETIRWLRLFAKE
jgi:hypothetical protein